MNMAFAEKRCITKLTLTSEDQYNIYGFVDGSEQNWGITEQNNFLEKSSSQGISYMRSSQPFRSKTLRNYPKQVRYAGRHYGKQRRKPDKHYQLSTNDFLKMRCQRKSHRLAKDFYIHLESRLTEHQKESQNQKFLKQINKEDLNLQYENEEDDEERRSILNEDDREIQNSFIKYESQLYQDEEAFKYQEKVQKFVQNRIQQHERTKKRREKEKIDCKVQNIQLFYRKKLKILPKGRKISQETLFFKQYNYETYRLLPIERCIEQECSLDDEETKRLLLCFVWEILNSGSVGFIFLNTIRKQSIDVIVSRIRQISKSLVPFFWTRRPLEAYKLITKGQARSMTGDIYDACIKVRKVKGKKVDYLLKCGQTFHKLLNYWIQSEYPSRIITIETLQFKEQIYSLVRPQC